MSARVIDELPQVVGRYRFSHTLIRETLYQELRTLERVRLHGRVGAALERLFVNDPEPHLAEIAHHFLESLPSGEPAKAVEYAVRAGDRATERLAYQEAAILYERALQALELLEAVDTRIRCELLLKLGEAQWNAGGFESPANVFREAAELAEKIGAPELLARAALGIGGPGVGFSMVGAQDEVEAAFLGQALAALDETDSKLRARVMARIAGQWCWVAGPEKLFAMARRAVEMARRIGDGQTLAYVLISTPWAILDTRQSRREARPHGGGSSSRRGGRRSETCRRSVHVEGNAPARDRERRGGASRYRGTDALRRHLALTTSRISRATSSGSGWWEI